jgi:Ca-activated chloride channel family protein
MRIWILAVGIATAPIAAADNVVLVLDASGSMWGQIDAVSKVEIARAAVKDLVDQWSPDDALGLVAYGHRRKGDCADIETLIPYGPLDAGAFLGKVNGLNALGMTPLSAAVIHGAEALKLSEQKATVILVSDGEETCKMDPCQVGAELEKRGVDFTAHVIGFDVPNPAHQAQLKCLADATGGRYFNARDAGELKTALGTLAKVSTVPALPPATATIKGPATAPISSLIEVEWTGPADQGDYVAFARQTGTSWREFDYAWAVADAARVTLTTPADPGDYELRYISAQRNSAVLARQSIKITDFDASIEAPDEVIAVTKLTVTARGPVAQQHWIGFAPKGSPASAYRDYERPTGPTSVIELTAPAEPGDYELRYVLNESERVLVAKPIKVLPASAGIEAPSSAEAGSDITVRARGPNDPKHWIGFAPAGSPPSTYRHYVRPDGEVTTAILYVPAQPGAYEIRFVLNESEKVLFSHPITVTEAQASVKGPAEVRAGATITVSAEGPPAARHWIGFAPAGSAAGTYRDYARPTGRQSQVELTAPEQPGDYELRYVLNESERVVARQPIKVLPK